jgi:hypothetical protein
MVTKINFCKIKNQSNAIILYKKTKKKMEGLVHVNNETSGFTSNILLYSIVISL